jgi:ankyrin repeat protein
MIAHSLLSWVVVGDAEGVKAALKDGADPNQKNESGISALHLAVSYRKMEVISMLIAHGADISAKNTNGDDVLDVAARRDDTEILDVIDRARRNRMMANKFPDPTPASVTPAAGASVAPPTGAGHS